MKHIYTLKTHFLLLLFLILSSLAVKAATTTVTFGKISSGTTQTYSAGTMSDGNTRRLSIRSNGTDASTLTAAADGYNTTTGGSKLGSTTLIGSALESKYYVKFTAIVGETITLYYYATGTTTSTSTLNVSDSTNTTSYLTSFSYTLPASKTLYSVTWTATASGTFYFSINGTNIYTPAITFSGASTSPTLAPTPTSVSSLYYNTAASTDNTGGNPSMGQFTLKGKNLTTTNAATVTAPTGFQISLTGTGGWGGTATVSPTADSINKVIYVRIDPTNTTVGTVSGSITFTQGDVNPITSVAVSGQVVNLTPISCPTTMTVSDVTYSGATFSWTNVSGNGGYIVKVYKTGVLVGSAQTLALNTTSYSITGLDQLTAYTVTVTVIGNGSTSGNSVECTAQAFTTTKAPSTSKTTCWTEDFETLSPSANTNSNVCPASGATTTELRYNADSGTPSGTNSCSNTFSLSLSSGTWTNGTYLGASGAGHGSSSRSLYVKGGSGTITFPTLDNPRTITFYVYAKTAVTSTSKGLVLSLDGSTITSNIKIDDAAYATTDGLIRFSSVGWHKVSVDLTSNTQNTFMLSITGDSSTDIWLDDVTVECSSMLLTASPNASGMNYVVDMGPSSVHTFTVTGTDLPNASGNITLSNLGNFQLSFDNGTTWSTGSSVTLPYTSSTFAQSVMVRLAAGLAVADYSTTIAFSCPGYTKIEPTLKLSGKVTLLPNTLPCGEEVTLLNMKGTNESNILLDDVTGTNWTAASATTKNNHFLLSKGASLTSPTISLGEYDLKSVKFSFQPSNATSMTMALSCFGDGGSFTPVTFSGSAKTPYTFTQDLSTTGFKDNFYLTFTDGSQTDIEMWDIVVTGVPKKQINLSTATLSGFASYSVDCPSAVQSLMVLGTCLDDNSSINFTSSLYEFSEDGVTWVTADASNVSKLTYTGSFPAGGMKVYVRQKGTSATTGFTASEVVNITNGGVGSASLLLSGTVTPPSDIQVPTSVSFSSLSGVSSIFSIPIVGGISCNPLVVSSNCSSLTLSNCKGGTYAATTTFAVDDSSRTLYLKYTPGADLNCTLTLTSGSFTKTISLTWTGVTSITNGVATDNSAVKYAAATGYGTTNVWKAGSLPDATTVTITSTDFDVSMGNPTYGDFVAISSAKLGDLKGVLYIRQKTTATSGTITLATAGGQTTTINVTVQ